MNKDFTKDLVFYEENSETTGHRKKFSYCRGRKSEKEGYYYPLLDMNTFADKPEKIPENAKKIRKPPLSIIRSYIYDPKKTHITKKDLPQHENDDMYPIHDNGGVPFVVYVSKNKTTVSIYRKPKMSYILDSDWSINFKDNIGYYHELIAQYENPINILIGKDYSNMKEDGNSILVQISIRKYVYIGTVYIVS